MKTKNFYNSPDRIAALRAAAKKCEGTPFAGNAMVPGAGMDCVHVHGYCYLNSGFLKNFSPPKYALDSGSHTIKSALIEWLENFQEDGRRFIRVETPQTGDTLCLQLPKTLSAHHAALVIDDGHFTHSIFFGEKKVVISNFSETFYTRRIKAIYRPMEAAN